jgi:two-component system, OmpR family, phosphate regulon sensor histidine kinase PhoR
VKQDALDRERAVAPSEARYAELLEFTPVGLALTDAFGVVKEINRAAADIIGLEARFMIGKPLQALIPPEARAAFRSTLNELNRDADVRTWTFDLVARDGAAVVVEVTAGPAGTGARADDLRWAFRDVSERAIHLREIRRLASELETRVLERTFELEEQRALLEAVIENIPAALLVIDRDRRPMLVNQEALRLFGLDRGQEGNAFASWETLELFRLDGTQLEAEERPIGRTLRDGEVVAAEIYEVVVKDRHALFDVSTAPVTSASGERIGALAVIRDVTARERTEQAERDFVTNAAHELQSPLAAIVSAVEVLQAGAKDGPERDVFLDHVDREANRLARLARALLILARTQMGLEAPRDELVGLCTLLEEIAGGLRLADGVRVEIDCAPDLAMLTNRELVEQALVNLAENAAKQTRKGTIALGARVLADRFVELAVADTGPGIPAAERSKVFQRFYRANGDGAVGGFGLGLAIVRAVAEALDGELELDSNFGEGTTVRLRVPGAARLVEN